MFLTANVRTVCKAAQTQRDYFRHRSGSGAGFCDLYQQVITININELIISNLKNNSDEKFREFNAKLMPTVPKEKIIGVRTPYLRNFAKELSARGDVHDFLNQLPHSYFEENQLHAFIISSAKDYCEVISELEKFLPFVDNWATCDQMNPTVFKRHLPELLEQIRVWITSAETYKIRFGLKMLMTYYLDDEFKTEYLALAASVKSQEYYVNMMIAWFFATALAKQYNSVLPYLKNNRLDIWVHNKTIQKATESFRINKEQKKYLKTLVIRANKGI